MLNTQDSSPFNTMGKIHVKIRQSDKHNFKYFLWEKNTEELHKTENIGI